MYKYTENNLLKNPEKYQMTSFLGEKFLDHYKTNRNAIICQIDNITNAELFENLQKTIKSKNLDIKKQSTQIETKSFLLEIIVNYTENDSINSIQYFDKLLKRFENTKKISSFYDNNINSISTKTDNILNYILFSLCCNLLYLQTNNLKYLNSALKTNDLIISTDLPKDDLIHYELLKITLQLEINSIKTISKNLGVKI